MRSGRYQVDRPIRITPWPWRLLSLVRLGRAMRDLDKRQDLDDPNPVLVALDPLSSEILNYARVLADDHREDERAVSDLIDLANGDERALRKAGLGARQNGEHMESSLTNLTHRLLEAAIRKMPVVQLGKAERTRLKMLDDFAAVSPAAQWGTLVERRPELKNLEVSARAGRFGRPLKQTNSSQQESRHAALERIRGREDLEVRLGSLVGPQSTADDPLMCSRLALDTARRYLLDIDE